MITDQEIREAGAAGAGYEPKLRSWTRVLERMYDAERRLAEALQFHYQEPQTLKVGLEKNKSLGSATVDQSLASDIGYASQYVSNGNYPVGTQDQNSSL